MASEKVTINVAVDADVAEALRKEAAEEDRTLSAQVGRVLRAHVRGNGDQGVGATTQPF